MAVAIVSSAIQARGAGGRYTPEGSYDYDGDGYSEYDGDCDDSDPAVHPGARERCNGVDDDCDGQTDEGMGRSSCGIGGCQRTVDNCVDGVPRTCAPGPPSPEVCNGIDDDCDGEVDMKALIRRGRGVVQLLCELPSPPFVSLE